MEVNREICVNLRVIVMFYFVLANYLSRSVKRLYTDSHVVTDCVDLFYLILFRCRLHLKMHFINSHEKNRNVIAVQFLWI